MVRTGSLIQVSHGHARRLVTGPSPQRPGFSIRPVRVRFVLDKVALGRVSVQVLEFFPLSIILLYSYLPQHVAPTIRKNRPSLGIFQNTMLEHYPSILNTYSPC
jgi:hypothetical protein